MAIPTVFTGFWCAGTVWSTVGALSGHCGALCRHVVPGCVVCAGVKAMVAPGHDGALLCLLSPTPCVLLWLLLLTLQLFFYTWHNPLSPASQVCSSCVIGFTSSLKYCLGPPLFAWRNLVSGTVDGQNPAPPHHFTLEGSHSNPRAPSFNVGVTPLRRWCRILDLQLVFVFSLWWPQCWRDPSEEVVQDFGPSTCFCFLTVVA